MRITRQDLDGVKPLLQTGELGYDNYPAGNDVGRVWVGTGVANIALAKKTEVMVVDGKADAHIARVDNPHEVTKAQVGLGLADNTADVDKNVLSATKLTTPRNITISGEVAGSVSFDGSTNVNISTTIQPNSVALGIDTTGNYVSSVMAGSGVTVTGVVGEGWTPSIAIAPVGTSGTYTKVLTNDKGQVVSGETLTANDIPNLDASKITSGIIDAARLPAYVDDVLEYASLSVFPAVGEAGKIYIALDTNKAYRWSGSTYVYITSGAVDSVAGKTGIVTLVKADVGLANVDNTMDINKPISTATQNALNLKANAASAVLTGIPTAPTAAVGTNTTQLATTAFVNAEIANNTYSKTQLDSTTVKLTGNQTISGTKTFSSNIVGGITGNAATATTLATARTVALTGDVTGSVNFDGSENVSITTTVVDDSHNHVISNVDGLQDALNSKAPLQDPVFVGTPKIGTDNVTSISTPVTDNAIARYDGATGKLQGSNVTITDTGSITIDATVNNNAFFGVNTSGSTTVNTTSMLNLTARGSDGSYNNVNIVSYGQAGNGSTLAIRTDNASGVITERMRIDVSGNLLLTSGTGALGYGTGAGGSVTQLTSKSTAVTLNKPTGSIYTHNEPLATGATVYFALNNSLLSVGDNLVVNNSTYGAYDIQCRVVTGGSAYIYITNTGGTILSQVLPIRFSIIKGVAS